jgi:hypothetical protein
MPAARLLLAQIDGIALQPIALREAHAAGPASACLVRKLPGPILAPRHAKLVGTVLPGKHALQADEREAHPQSRVLASHPGELALLPLGGAPRRGDVALEAS